MTVEEKEKEEEEGWVLVRVLCPVDRIGGVSRLQARSEGNLNKCCVRFDSASASPFPSDRVVLISASESSDLQAALLAVFERIVIPNPHPHSHVICRLLAPSSQVSSLDRLRQHSPAAQFLLLPRDHAFPNFHAPFHLLTISGTFPAVNNALLSLSSALLPPPPPTQVHVLLPSLYLPFLSAPDLSHIQLISGANLTLQDPKPADATAKVIVSGTPDQTKTAQSLLHGLIFCAVFNPS